MARPSTRTAGARWRRSRIASADVYTDEGLFDFTSEGAVEALKLMKQIMAFANPDILLEGATDGGVNGTPDEVVFAAQKATYYTKYFNSPLRFAANWQDPTQLQLGGLPKFANGEGSTVFWSTGACLFKYGQNKDKAVEYMKALTYNEKIWQDSIAGTPTAHPGQLPPYTSLYTKWDAEKPSWMQPLRRAHPRPARDRQGHPEPRIWPAAVCDRQAILGDLPEGRGSRPDEGACRRSRTPSPPRSRRPANPLLHCQLSSCQLSVAATDNRQPTTDKAMATLRTDTQARSVAGARSIDLRGSENWLFLLPMLFFFIGYQAYPILRVLWISFTDYKYLRNEPANWVGLETTAMRWSTRLCTPGCCGRPSSR